MDEELMKRSEIGALLGHTNPASTRKWIAVHGLEAKGRDTVTGEKEYSAAEVYDAKAKMPGRGFRPPAAKDSHERDPGPLPTAD